MHLLWNDYLADRAGVGPSVGELTVPIGGTLPRLPIIPAARSNGKCWKDLRGRFLFGHQH
jgi:hypothetical protein